VPDISQGPLVVSPGPLVKVSDPYDPRLESYRDLNDPAGRIQRDSDQSVFVVEGRLAVERLLRSRYTVCSLLVDDHQVTAAGELVMATRARGAPVYVGPAPVVTATVGFALHRGVVAIARRPPPTDAHELLADVVRSSDPERSPPVIAILEGLNDHQNIGALFRNAAAFGVAAVLLDPTCADPLYRRSIRVSVGHILHVPFARLVPWPTGLSDVRAAGFVVASLTPRPPADSATGCASLAELKAQMSGSAHPVGVALLFGAEGPGLSQAAVAESDLVVAIPMADGVDSLNVATAAAVAFHALARA
jgi:tRNA G18 (ribose-2'-O)-methylase SpoU